MPARQDIAKQKRTNDLSEMPAWDPSKLELHNKYETGLCKDKIRANKTIKIKNLTSFFRLKNCDAVMASINAMVLTKPTLDV